MKPLSVFANMAVQLFALALMGQVLQTSDDPAFAMPIYPDARYVPVGDELELSGRKAVIGQLLADDSIEKVVAFYRTEMKKWGYAPVETTGPDGRLTLFVLDGKSDIQRSATIWQQKSLTAVLLSAVSMLPESQEDSFIPIFPGSVGVEETKSRDGNSRNVMLSFINDGSVEQNVAFLQEEMSARGWQVLPERKTEKPRGAVVSFSGKGMGMTAIVTSDGKSTMVAVILGEEGSLP